MILSARPPVTANAVMPEYQRKTRNVELLFDWLVHGGSPRFAEELILAVDDCLETGRGILKSYWLYETRQTPTYLTASRLPARLRQLIVTQRDEKEADNLFVAAGGAAGAIVLTKREFDRMHDPIEAVVKKEFDLDDEEPRDQKAINTIMSWLRGGARDSIKVESRDIIVNVPAARAVSPIDYVVPENATDNVEEHERICEVMYFTKQQLETYALDNKLNRKAVEHVLQKRARRGVEHHGAGGGNTNIQKTLIEAQSAAREGTASDGTDDNFEVWKVCTRMSSESFGTEKKVIALIPADAPEAVLKIKAHSRPSGKWGHHTFAFEANKRRWYSPRGVPEKLDDLEAEITAQHRAKINRMAIVTNPTMKYRPGKSINPATMKWFPGQMYPTNDPQGDMVEMQFQQLDPVFDNEIQQLRVWAESYLGGPDYGLTDNSTLSEARTATEIQAIQSQARASLSMRGLLLKLACDEMWTEWFDLWHTLGPAEVYIKVTGGDEPMRLTKEELQGKFLLQCTGTIGSSDPALEAQKAQARIILMAQIKQSGMLGLEYDINMGELIRDWMEKDDIRLMKRVLIERSPEEIQAIQQQMQQAAAAQKTQELALAAAGQKPPKQSGSKNGQQRGGLPQLPAMGGRN
jgi:hypothetical protein